MRTIGAWLTRSALTSPTETAREIAASGVTMASIMCNDFSGSRRPQMFATHDPGKIGALADACHEAGLEVTLTTWVMPHAGFITGMGTTLPGLLSRCGATALILDAEEPWVRAVDPLPDEEAARRIREIFPATRLVLTAIGSADRERLDGLAAVCDVFAPQAYATTRAGDPDRTVQYCHDQWVAKFGVPREGWLMGLAAYRQPIPPRSHMQPCLDHAEALGIQDVCYWSHRPILERPDVREVISGIPADGPVARPVGGDVFPAVDVEALPSGVPDGDVACLQGWLAAAALEVPDADPGAVDGMPGPATLRGLEGFQRVRGLTVTGVADRRTWGALVGRDDTE